MNTLKFLHATMLSGLVLTQVCFASDAGVDVEPLDSSVQQQDKAFFADNKRGWFFYEQKPVAPPKRKAPEPKPLPQMSPSEVLKQQGKEYEDAAALAILQPSAANYRNYMERTKAIMEQSENFATGLKEYTYVAPEYDYALKNPQGNGVQISNIALNENKAQTLNKVSKDNALIFVFRSDCPYCHKFAPIMRNFAAMNGFTVLAISMDAKGLPEYPNPRYSPSLLQRLKVQAVPAVYLLNPQENKVSTVGFGLTDSDTLGDKIIATMSRSTNNKVQP